MELNREQGGVVRSYFRKKGLPLQPALTFADVTIEDDYSEIESRSDITNLKTRLAREVWLNVPIVSANMDTVTESRMAIALARQGGLGFIHQFLSLEERLKEIEKVKRADNAVIDDPVTVLPTATLGEAKTQMNRYRVSSALVVDKNKKLLGILTYRDYRLKTNDSLPVTQLMTSMPLITASPGIDRKEAEKIFDEHDIEKLPLIDRRGRLVGLICAKDFFKEREFPNALKDKKGRLMVGVTLRLKSDYLKEAEALLKAGVDVLLLDTARGYCKQVRQAVEKIKAKFPNAPLVAGNIDKPEAALMLIKAGADCLKVGIGPGRACKTRVVAGVGIPQITAVASCAAIAKKYNIPIIADGGIETGAHLGKALIAGANAVMIGKLFAGTEESPGLVFHDESKQWKFYRGSASAEEQLDRVQAGNLDKMRAPEGAPPTRVPYVGLAKVIIEELLDGLRSSMSYVGASNPGEYWKKGKLRWQTLAGYEEGKPQI